MPEGRDGRAEVMAWWGLVSATSAPVLLIGGWTIAASRQPGAFDQVRDTVSALAGLGATDRWLMTTALAAVGTCHLATATALRPAPRAGRLLLGLGGMATIGVAAFPLPLEGGSTAHTICAAVAFGSLAVWPAMPSQDGTAQAGRPRSSGQGRPTRSWRARQPTPVRRPVRMAAAGVLVALVGWFIAELVGDGSRVGLAERVAAGAQAIWPLATAIGLSMEWLPARGSDRSSDGRRSGPGVSGPC